MSNPILAWHFLTKDLIPGVGRRRKPLYVGHMWREKGPPVLCKHGLHASERILDALGYAYSPVVCRVLVSGTVVHGNDKLVGTRRKILAMGDIETLLHTWACDVAEAICGELGITDELCWAAIEVKRQWTRREATDGELTAARNAAQADAGNTTKTAARTAAEDAAWAVRAAVMAATKTAAWAAARDAAWAAARDAAWAARVAARAAAKVAAEASAWDAAWAAMNADLEKRVLQVIGSTEVTSQT